MADHIGQRLGKYRLINLLGHGGYADVYLGEHIYIKTMAAVKVLQAQLEQEDVEKFRNEALMIAHLVHPHIVRVLDFDVDHYTPFLVMDYAPNGNLRGRHPKGTRVPPQIFLPYVKQVASALQYAHDQKLIHRDVKPENMLVGRNDEILLSDFGIALIAQSSHSQSTDQMVTGTISYMAPEQIQGRPRPASDQYSLAVVVYEWLMGMKPFSGSSGTPANSLQKSYAHPSRPASLQIVPVSIRMGSKVKTHSKEIYLCRVFRRLKAWNCQGTRARE